MPVVHLASVDPLKSESACDDIVHIQLDGLGTETEKADLSAVSHGADHLLEGRAAAAHLKADIKALDDLEPAHDLAKILPADIYRGVHAHFFGKVQPVIIEVCDDYAPRARKFADAGRDYADGTGAGNKHILSDKIPHQRGMRSVAECVKERDHVFVQLRVDSDNVFRGDAEVFGKRAVPVHAHADRFMAPLDISGVAVAAVAAGNMAFAADPLPDGKAGDSGPELRDLSDILVSDGLTYMDVFL